jgi:hypothetical protein
VELRTGEDRGGGRALACNKKSVDHRGRHVSDPSKRGGGSGRTKDVGGPEAPTWRCCHR